jgi:hypothetical protein
MTFRLFQLFLLFCIATAVAGPPYLLYKEVRLYKTCTKLGANYVMGRPSMCLKEGRIVAYE